jgi:hypothetical protein
MNWELLKEKYPLSYTEIREFSKKTDVTDSRGLINEFLKSKGYYINTGFINQLKDYEKKTRQKGKQIKTNEL